MLIHVQNAHLTWSCFELSVCLMSIYGVASVASYMILWWLLLILFRFPSLFSKREIFFLSVWIALRLSLIAHITHRDYILLHDRLICTHVHVSTTVYCRIKNKPLFTIYHHSPMVLPSYHTFAALPRLMGCFIVFLVRYFLPLFFFICLLFIW